MASISVFVCPTGQQFVTPEGISGCEPGAGAWQQVTLAEPFDAASLDGSELSAALGAGFMCEGILLVAARSIWRLYHSVSQL